MDALCKCMFIIIETIFNIEHEEQHCASPFLQLRAGPRVKLKMRTLIKLLPLKYICVNELTLTALILKCNYYSDGKAEFSAVITPVFSVT